jgi:hypothetical protein
LRQARALCSAASAPHGVENLSDDFSVRVIFYGPQKSQA